MICVLDGFEPDGLAADILFRLETLGGLLMELGKRGVTEVCFCGGIERPEIDPSKLDKDTAPLVPLLAEAISKGDDGALRAVMGIFEKTGFRVRAAHELVPDLVAPPGVLTELWPDAQMRADAVRGAAILAALAPHDVGQSCVVGQGQLLGIETLGGTDFMLGSLPDAPQRKAGILVKGPKLGQDTRADMPTVGPQTARAVASAGLRGLVIDAGDVILLEPEETTRICNENKLVLWSRIGDG